jgi:cytochrome c553
MRFLKYILLLSLAGASWKAVAETDALKWDADSITNHAQPGDIASRFTFNVRNISTTNVVIDELKTSCGCTAASMPSKPWKIAPHETSKLEAVVDLRGKHGTLYKEVILYSSNAVRTLKVTVEIPDATNNLSPEMASRVWGQQLAAIDRQAVFKSDCVKCHLVPAFGKEGEKLFHTTCGICHEAKHRATMVPDLSQLKTEIPPNYWRNWVTYGKPGTLMPGFTATLGGPLDDAQIDGLVQYLTNAFPRPINPTAKDNSK